MYTIVGVERGWVSRMGILRLTTFESKAIGKLPRGSRWQAPGPGGSLCLCLGPYSLKIKEKHDA